MKSRISMVVRAVLGVALVGLVTVVPSLAADRRGKNPRTPQAPSAPTVQNRSTQNQRTVTPGRHDWIAGGRRYVPRGGTSTRTVIVPYYPYYPGFYYGWGDPFFYGAAGYYGYYGMYPYGPYAPYPGSAPPGYESVQPAAGLVQTDVKPSRAHVYVDGEDVGRAWKYNESPDELWLDPGSHTIEFEADGYMPLRLKVDVQEGKYYRLRYDLRKGEGLDSRSTLRESAIQNPEQGESDPKSEP